MSELVPAINERVLTIAQFEHIDALAHIDEILDTPGLDVLFVGPTDLHQSMGFGGQCGTPRWKRSSSRSSMPPRDEASPWPSSPPTPTPSTSALPRDSRWSCPTCPALLMKRSRDLLAEPRAVSDARLTIRQANPADYDPVIASVDAWWGGRQHGGHAATALFHALRAVDLRCRAGRRTFRVSGGVSVPDGSWAWSTAISSASIPKHRRTGSASGSTCASSPTRRPRLPRSHGGHLAREPWLDRVSSPPGIRAACRSARIRGDSRASGL